MLNLSTPRPAEADPFLFPHLGPYPAVYDDAAYSWMTSDVARERRFRKALEQHAPGKVVADIGTGRDVNWASVALAAGASRAYAIEWSPTTFAQAQQTVRRLGLEDRIVLIQGNSLEIELPEKADLIVSEILGGIGSTEGQWVLMQDARRRLLKEGGRMIPERCITRCAATSLPSSIYDEPRLSRDGERYARRIFELVGHPFDLRFGIAHFDPEDILSTPGTFEDLDFQAPGPQPLSYAQDSTLRITKSGRLDGITLWLELYCGSIEDPLDSLRELSNWYPTFFPIFYPGIEVAAGDELQLSCRTALSDDGLHPDYFVTGELRRTSGTVSFQYASPHHGSLYQSNPFYKKLLGTEAFEPSRSVSLR